jgi:glucose-1-phosphate thymidylyltransferase
VNGILLAAGAGTRLYPLTNAVSKQLLPVYDKPMVYYPLSTLMLAGIRDILVITSTAEQALFGTLLGDGSQWGIHLSYAVQQQPDGIAQAFLIGRDVIAEDGVALILGDNIFYGHGLVDLLRRAVTRDGGATVFGYLVRDPERYGVVTFDGAGRATSIEEKPERPRSSWAITGLGFYDSRVADVAQALKPSTRGELEITDVNNWYLEHAALHVERLGRGLAWLDTGTHESLLMAANFIHTVQERQGLRIACLEEVAYHMGFIDAEQVLRLAATMEQNTFGDYLRRVVGRWDGL